MTNNANFETGYGSTFVNNGELRLVYTNPTGNMPPQPMPMADLGLPGDSSLQNNGVINLNGNVIHDGTLNNLGAGIINGNGYILSNFVNNGVVNMNGSPLNISKAFTNRGTINLYGTLFGGTITNNGTIEGGSNGATVGNAIVNHGMVGVGGGGKVTMAGALTNNTDGLITVRTDSKFLINQGLAVNDGVISVSGGYFDNNNYMLTNNGKIAAQRQHIQHRGPHQRRRRADLFHRDWEWRFGEPDNWRRHHQRREGRGAVRPGPLYRQRHQ